MSYLYHEVLRRFGGRMSFLATVIVAYLLVEDERYLLTEDDKRIKL